MPVKTARNGRPYHIGRDGRARFLSDADAKRMGWKKSAPKKSTKTRSTKRRASRRR